MNTTNKRRMQLSLFAAAVLAIVAVAAVMMAAGGNPAQATTATLAVDGAGDGNPLPPQQQQDTPPPTPRFPEPDRCSAIPAEVVSSGHIALFDVYWHPREKELTLNPCPPLHTHVPAQEGGRGQPATPARDERSPSGINIMADPPTIIHVPNTAEVDLSASTTYTEAKYPEVWAADDKENRDTDDDGTGDGVGDRKVWVLPACPDGALTDSLCLGFSADLLNPEDWGDTDGAVVGDGKVQYRIIRAHQHNVGEQGRGAVLAYHVPGARATAPYAPVWDTSDADRNKMQVLPGEYEHPIWFFTRAGRYEFQVQVKGHPEQGRDDGLAPVSPDTTVTSDVRDYTFYVGPLTLNQDPVFGIERAVPENSAAGVAAGRPAPVLDEDAGDTHTFNLTGGGADKFTLSTTGDGVQIAVADGAVLNYEDRQSYDLTLQVSDGKDRFSNVDDSVDDTIPVRIVVEDDPNEQLAVTLEADRTTQTIGQGVRLKARVHNSPVSSGRLSYRHHEQNVGGGRSLTELTQYTTRTVTWDGAPVSREYTMTVWVTDGGTNAPQVTSNRVVIDWTN